MLKKEDINFLINGIGYFRDYRSKNLQIFNNIFKRLDNFLDNPKQDQKLIKNSTSLLTKLLSTIFLVLRQIFRMPYYIIQTLNLRRSQCEFIKSCEAFAIASSRLELNETESFASQIEHITKVIGGGDILHLFSGHDQIQKTIIIYDPQLESGFWKWNRTFHNEKLFIVDGAYIIFLSLVLLFSGLFFRSAKELIFLIHYLKQSKVCKNGKDIRVHIRVVEALTFIAYDNIINKLPKHSTKFLTSNSFFTELLRLYILQNEGSGKIIELMHGMLDESGIYWYERLLSSLDKAKNKHLLIPFVPNIINLSNLNYKYFAENNKSINSHLNSSLYKKENFYGSYKDYALNCLKQLNLKTNEKVFTITIYGGTSIGVKFFNSSAFKTEIKILDKIINYFLNQKKNIKIIYAPHPRQKILSQWEADFFKKKDVQVFDDSVFTYFITDCCVSNISSCLFELNWLGAECFSPIIEADGLYCKNFLDTIHHPEADGIKALENSLYGCLNAGLSGGSKSYIEKLNNRLKIIKGENVN